MGFQIGQTIENKDFVLKSNNKFQDVSKCSGCDCCEPCEFAEWPTESGAMAKAMDLGLEEAFLINTKNGNKIYL